MGLKAVANPAAGGQPGSFTTLTVSGAATIGGGLAVTGSISATNGYYHGAALFALAQGGSNNLYAGAAGLVIYDSTGAIPVADFNAGAVNVTGSISATDYIAGAEKTPPSAPAANGYRIFAQDNGAGKTQLMVIFASGAAQQIAIEP